jgi:hypothetical protein
MAGIERKIFVAIRCVFAYSEGSSAGSGAGGTLPIGNPGLPEKACNSVVLWAFVSLPDAAASVDLIVFLKKEPILAQHIATG